MASTRPSGGSPSHSTPSRRNTRTAPYFRQQSPLAISKRSTITRTPTSSPQPTTLSRNTPPPTQARRQLPATIAPAKTAVPPRARARDPTSSSIATSRTTPHTASFSSSAASKLIPNRQTQCPFSMDLPTTTPFPFFPYPSTTSKSNPQRQTSCPLSMTPLKPTPFTSSPIKSANAAVLKPEFGITRTGALARGAHNHSRPHKFNHRLVPNVTGGLEYTYYLCRCTTPQSHNYATEFVEKPTADYLTKYFHSSEYDMDWVGLCNSIFGTAIKEWMYIERREAVRIAKGFLYHTSRNRMLDAEKALDEAVKAGKPIGLPLGTIWRGGMLRRGDCAGGSITGDGVRQRIASDGKGEWVRHEW